MRLAVSVADEADLVLVTGSFYVLRLLGRRSTASTGRSLRAMNRTLVICKPDAVERGLVGEIMAD
ncbi:MAG: hypothetical protein CM1200mP26_23290 [Acidimicrobiales bacterium]|nr:MAG: hypothetical protein CM1200mP26_23290 [Acidimicrobiales bacterium]